MEQTFTAEEVAARLGIGLPTLYSHVRNGVTVHYRVVRQPLTMQKEATCRAAGVRRSRTSRTHLKGLPYTANLEPLRTTRDSARETGTKRGRI